MLNDSSSPQASEKQFSLVDLACGIKTIAHKIINTKMSLRMILNIMNTIKYCTIAIVVFLIMILTAQATGASGVLAPTGRPEGLLSVMLSVMLLLETILVTIAALYEKWDLTRTVKYTALIIATSTTALYSLVFVTKDGLEDQVMLSVTIIITFLNVVHAMVIYGSVKGIVHLFGPIARFVHNPNNG